MINVVFAKMDTFLRYGQNESIDLNKLSYNSTTPLSSRSSGNGLNKPGADILLESQQLSIKSRQD